MKTLILENAELLFEVEVRNDADLDGTFRAYDRENNEHLTVNGWLFEITDVTDCPAFSTSGEMRAEQRALGSELFA